MSVDYQYTSAKKRIVSTNYNEYTYKFDATNDNIIEAIVKMWNSLNILTPDNHSSVDSQYAVYSASWRRASKKKINIYINKKVRSGAGVLIRKNMLEVTADIYNKVMDYIALGERHWSDCIYCGDEAKNKHPKLFGAFVCDGCKEEEVDIDE